MNQQNNNEFNEEEWKLQWEEAQKKVEKQKQQELKQSNKASGPESMVLEGDPVKQVPEDQLPYFTYEELAQYNGVINPKSYVAVCDIIFDTTGSGYYGSGETYHLLAGNEGSVSLAKMSFESVFLNKYGIIGMTKKEMECLRDWYDKFSFKYLKVGKLRPKEDKDMTEQDHIDMELISKNNYENPCTQQ